MMSDQPPGPAPARHAAASLLHAGRRLVSVLGAAAVVWLAGLVWFAHSIPSPGASALSGEPTDAVVVLTGGPLRLKAGLAVLEAGQAKKLFVSGVAPRVELNQLLRAAQHPAGGPNPAIECCVVLGHAADNTAGNAAETRAWMEKEGFHSLRLVTASFHMPRSLLEFRRAMPEATIVPNPVFQEGFMRDTWWAWPGTLALTVSEYDKYLAAWARSQLSPAS